jgi:class 3 adenylate cyclase/tetratricopeptide (TPR) repeat protein
MEGMIMKCPQCRFDNRAGVKFCEECGAKLDVECPRCKAKIPPDRKFCGECGHKISEASEARILDFSEPQSYTPKFLADKILTSRSSIEGERKRVTVFFADVADYTALSEKLDPEEVHQIMDGCFKILLDEIHRYEGTINQFTGDGVMALFGAPVAHEDHAQRACHAALSTHSALREYGQKIENEHGVEFKLRIGLNSGPVIVGSIGDDLRMDYTAVGDTTNLAARMESMATPGTALATAHTHRLARDFFKFEPLGRLRVKGKQQLVEAFTLLEAAEVETRIEASAARGLTKLVGRGREMATLSASFDKARSGSGQVVGVVGEAGVGKSRLLIELKNMLPKGKYTYLEGQCLHYGGSMAYLPLLDVLKSYFEIKEEDREYIIKKKISHKILQLNERLSGTLPSLHEILSLKVEDGAYLQLEPGVKKLRTFEAIRDLFVCESEKKTLVMAIEDIQWIDSISQEFLSYLIDWLSGARILLILLYRPEYTHPWGSKSYYSKIGVDQLSGKSSAQLVQNILAGGEVVPQLKELIINRAGGNPLFVEELTHSLVENGSIQKKDHQYVLAKDASEIDVPDSIQGIIAARLDRVEENLKRIMQVASVIGREFAYRILQTIMGMKEELKSSLINLQGLEFIYEKRLFPELEYIFKHALTQEVAYNSLLQKRRKEIHGKIGGAIEDLYPDRLEEYYELLAYHYVRSDNRDKAVVYLDLANQKAARLNAMEDALSYFEAAMKILDTQPDTESNRQRRVTLLVNQWLVFTLLFRFTDYHDILKPYEQLAIDLGDPGLLGRFYATVGACQWWLGNYDQAIQTLGKAPQLCEASGAYEYAAVAANFLQWTYLFKGDFTQVFKVKEEVFRYIEQRFHLRACVWAFVTTSWACLSLKRWDEAAENGKEALKVAEEFSDHSLIAFAGAVLCQAYCFKGELNRAIEYGELAAQKAPTPADRIWAQGFLAMAWCRAGKLNQAIETLAEIIAVHKIGRFKAGEVGYSVMLGYGYFLAGEYDKATQTLKEVLELAERSGMKWFIGNAHLFLGQVFLKTSPAEAGFHFEQGLMSFQQTGADPPILEFMRGSLLVTQGHLQQGVKVLEDTSEVFLKNGSLWDHLTTEHLLGNIYLQAVSGEDPGMPGVADKNIAVRIKNFPRAVEKAEYHLNKAIGGAKDAGANSILGQSYYNLGLLHKAGGRNDEARGCFSRAIQIFEECKTEVYLAASREALQALK